VTVNDMLKAIE